MLENEVKEVNEVEEVKNVEVKEKRRRKRRNRNKVKAVIRCTNTTKTFFTKGKIYPVYEILKDKYKNRLRYKIIDDDGICRCILMGVDRGYEFELVIR